jgi:hypothetical protein
MFVVSFFVGGWGHISTDQSAMSLIFKAEYMARAVVRLVDIFNC